MIDLVRIEQEKEQLQKRLRHLKDLIEAYQKVCDHEWEDDGHDSHHNYIRCKSCHLRDRV